MYTTNYSRATALASFRSSPTGMCNALRECLGCHQGAVEPAPARALPGRPMHPQGTSGASRGPREPPGRPADRLGYTQRTPLASLWPSWGLHRAPKNPTHAISVRPGTARSPSRRLPQTYKSKVNYHNPSNQSITYTQSDKYEYYCVDITKHNNLGSGPSAHPRHSGQSPNQKLSQQDPKKEIRHI